MTRETDYITLELYLDGELPASDNTALEGRLAAEPELAQALAHLKNARELRMAALQTYQPDATETRILADSAIAFCRDNRYSPLARIFHADSGSPWIQRLGLAAACLLIAMSSYWAGRSSVGTNAKFAAPSSASSIIGYTVQISTPGGQVVSQTFTTYQQAREFAQTYTADEHVANSPSATTSQVASAADTGMF